MAGSRASRGESVSNPVQVSNGEEAFRSISNKGSNFSPFPFPGEPDILVGSVSGHRGAARMGSNCLRDRLKAPMTPTVPDCKDPP